MKLSFAFSPCPNDTFMFEPIIQKRIDLEGIDFEIIMQDVEQLNKAAFAQRYDISKLSFNAFTQLTDTYQLLSSGSALGRNCGPLLISKDIISPKDVSNTSIAIPGKNTTAYLLLQFAFPALTDVREMLFSDIEAAVTSDECAAGVIIHENRFTYADRGLHKIMDLGEYWETQTGSPIPLGGIAVSKNLDPVTKAKVQRIIHRSVQYAFDHPTSGLAFIKSHAQEMDEAVMFAHIDLYVNEFSKNLGDEGKKAVHTLFKIVRPALTAEQIDTYFL